MSDTHSQAARGGGRRSASLPILLACFLAGATLVGAQEETYACIPTASGDSADANHTGWIVAYGLDQGVMRNGNPSVFTDVSILKGTDSSTVRLHELVSQGITVPKVVIDVCRDSGGVQDCYYTLVLENAQVSQLDLAGSACVDTSTSCTPAQTESVSFTFEKITWIYGGGASTFCWNPGTQGTCATPGTAACTP